MSDRITTEEVERIAGENEREGVLAGEDGRMWGSRRTVELGERLIACAAVIRSLAAERDELRVGMELAWGIIANAHEGGWENAPSEWREAAERWRDDHWHTSLDRAALGEEAE